MDEKNEMQEEQAKPKTPEQEMPRLRFRERYIQLYPSFRFAVTLPERDNALLKVASIYNDPFTDELWIGRGHVQDEKTLAQRLCELTHLDIWMLPRGDSKARLVHAAFKGLRALPINLDAFRDEVALEWVVLQHAVCSVPADVEVPEQFRDFAR